MGRACGTVSFLCVAALAGVVAAERATVSQSPAARLLSNSTRARVHFSERLPFPCDNPPIQWMCNTTQFCNAANRMKEDGCWFMPAYCEPRCHDDIKKLAHTDCVEHPGKSPFLERIALEVEEQLR